MQITVVFQNSNFIVIDKPGGILSVPSRMGASDPRPVAGILLQNEVGQKIFPVHRLDEEVSGLLMFALNQAAHRAANLWFEHHEVVKTYEAIAPGILGQDLGNWAQTETWECKLMRGKKRAYEANYGKKSVTKARFVGISADNRSIWHLQPLTGRSHQLRYEMSRHGFPIDGDELYGSPTTFHIENSIALRAVRLDFASCSNRGEFSLPEQISLPTIAPLNDF